MILRFPRFHPQNPQNGQAEEAQPIVVRAITQGRGAVMAFSTVY